MASKNTVLVKLESTEGTGTYFVKKRNPKQNPNKLEFRKFDPKAGKDGKGAHVKFVEKKLKS
jgi:large subunit ribosomal protein L33